METGIEDTWDAEIYEREHAYIWKNGIKLLDLLRPQKGERILDIGCGTGQIAAKIAEAGAHVVGIDSSPNMIQRACANYAALQFTVADGMDFHFATPFDAVFSHSALHWMREPARVIDNIWQCLTPTGRFVAGFGAKGTVRSLTTALHKALAFLGYPASSEITPWYYPSIGEYAQMLEQRGFFVKYADVLGGLSALDGGERAIQNWIEMFGHSFLAGVPAEKHPAVIRNVEDQLRTNFYRNDTWFLDYRVIRIVALKEPETT